MLVHDLMAKAEPHINIVNTFAKCWNILGQYSKPVISVSGGADSDIVLDMIHTLDEERRAAYVFLNTGLEYHKLPANTWDFWSANTTSPLSAFHP